jgi:hypothetical protein
MKKHDKNVYKSQDLLDLDKKGSEIGEEEVQFQSKNNIADIVLPNSSDLKEPS